MAEPVPAWKKSFSTPWANMVTAIRTWYSAWIRSLG